MKNSNKLSVVMSFVLPLAFSVAHAQTAYFSVVAHGGEPRTIANEFVLGVTDPETIQRIRNEIETGTEPVPFIPTGVIEKGRQPYNEAWPFNYVPETVRITSNTTEVCDASPDEVEDNLHLIGTDFLPDRRWCPWTVRFVREVKVKQNKVKR